MGSYKAPTICDEQNILAVSNTLQKVEILNGDYTQTLNHAADNTFFYFDPPYKPLSQTSSFNSYAKDEFNDDEQIRLRDFCAQLETLGHKWMLSNSDVKGKDINDTFFDDINLGVPSGRAFRSNLLLVPHKRIYTSIPNAKLAA
jgi:DNA adenine methylase